MKAGVAGRITVVLALFVTAVAAEAQQAAKAGRVGWIVLPPGTAATQLYFDAFRAGMRERGWVEGQNLVIDARSGNREQAQALAAELVKWRADVIVTQGPMVFGARAVAGATPVVFVFSGDPVEAKLVASLARPGGNLTGISLLSFELVSKRLELLKEALPGLRRVAVLANVAHPGEQAELRTTQATAQRLGLTILYLPVRSVGEIDTAFDAIIRERAEAIVAFPDVLIMSRARDIAEFAARHRIPAVSGWTEFATAGNFMTYGPTVKVWHQVASQVDKILRGAKPADLPVEQPTDFELTINLLSARTLGLTIPPSLSIRADKLIE